MAVFLSIVTLSTVCSSLLSGLIFISSPSIFAFAALLATATALPYGLFLLWLDRNEKEPIGLIAIAFLWGAMGATLIGGSVAGVSQLFVAAVSNSPELSSFYGTSIAAPFFEEAFKGLGVLAIYIAFRHEFDNVLDGIIYGAIVGLGFAWFENILYYQSIGLEEGFGAMAELAIGRGVYHGIAGHVTFTALTGLGLGLARVGRTGIIRWCWPFIGFGLGTFSHFTWNTFAGFVMWPAPNETAALLLFLPLAVIILQLPFVALVGTVIAFVWRHENQIIVKMLSSEDPEFITPHDIQQLTPARKRTVASFIRFFKLGPKLWWKNRRFQRALIDLSFALWHHQADYPTLSRDDNPNVKRHRTHIASYKQHLQR
jgi:RsiW-degrading membrane proteinase PrsW (M82 family)